MGTFAALQLVMSVFSRWVSLFLIKPQKFIQICCVVLAFFALSFANEPLQVGVRDFSSETGDSALSRQFAAALTNVLVKSGKIRILERERMETILSEQTFQQSGACNSETCQVEVGRLLGVDDLIVGSLARIDGKIAVNARLLSMRTGEIKANAYLVHDGSSADLVEYRVQDVAHQLFTEIPASKYHSSKKYYVSLGLGILSLAVLGGGIYMNTKVSDHQAYEAAKSQAVVLSDKKTLQDDASLRNILYGTAGGLAACGLTVMIAF
jgi:TolB-like protein